MVEFSKRGGRWGIVNSYRPLLVWKDLPAKEKRKYKSLSGLFVEIWTVWSLIFGHVFLIKHKLIGIVCRVVKQTMIIVIREKIKK